MKHFIALFILVTSQISYAAPPAIPSTRDFCFRGYSSGISSISIQTTGTVEEATFSDTIILQRPMTSPVLLQSNGERIIEVQTDNVSGYDVGGITIQFIYEDLQTRLKGEYAIKIGSTVVGGGDFIAYLKTSSECNRPTAPSLQISQTPIYRNFVSNVTVDTQKIVKLSRFNSGFGHSYTTDTSCRSQLHYFIPTNQNDMTIDLRLPNTATGTSWKLWSWIWELGDDPNDRTDRTIIFQNTQWPWLYISIHHVITPQPPLLGSIVPGDTIIGVARSSTDNVTAYNISVEYLDANNNMAMMSIFDLYNDDVIRNNFPALVDNGQVDRSKVILSDSYRWKKVETTDPNRAAPSLRRLSREARCLGHYPNRARSIFPHALADDFVVHANTLAKTLIQQAPNPITAPTPATRRSYTCEELNLTDIDPLSPTGFCNIQEKGSSALQRVRKIRPSNHLPSSVQPAPRP